MELASLMTQLVHFWVVDIVQYRKMISSCEMGLFMIRDAYCVDLLKTTDPKSKERGDLKGLLHNIHRNMRSPSRSTIMPPLTHRRLEHDIVDPFLYTPYISSINGANEFSK